MTTFKHPNFQTNEAGEIRIADGEFEGTIFKYKDISIDDEGTLKYNSELQLLLLNGEDITLTHTEQNEAKFLNTVATPLLSTIVEGLQQLEQERQRSESK